MTNRPTGGGRAVALLIRLLSAASVSALFGGCLYDPQDRCGENQELAETGDACVCIDGAAQIGRECILCGDNEVPGQGACDCEEGYDRNGAGVCVRGFDGFAEECSDDSDCPEDGASRCVSSDSGSFCSLDCEEASDCPSPAGCEVDETEPYCVPAPSGLDTPCSSSDECEPFEANYCETMLENKCKVQCKDEPGVCHGDWACCDYSNLIGAALCVSSSDLEDGRCPFGGDLVEANR